jgi:hypothetical protein
MMTWDTIDWQALAELRQQFLTGDFAPGGYWRTRAHLEAYHLSFAERIGWKWDAVLSELQARGWQAPAGHLFDWGCGTGVATGRWLAAHRDHTWQSIRLFDQSLTAAAFARDQLLHHLPALHPVPQIMDEPPAGLPAGSTVLLSHVITELDFARRAQLIDWLQTATTIVWVEPGTQAASHALVAARDALVGSFHAVAPCTHDTPCPMRRNDACRHWCHHFGHPPVEAFTSSHWARFATLLSIDLRSLPYAFLVLDKRPLPDAPADDQAARGGAWQRLIGRPREYKGYHRPLLCGPAGLSEPMLQKRDHKAAFQRMRKGRELPLYQICCAGDRVATCSPHPGPPLDQPVVTPADDE